MAQPKKIGKEAAVLTAAKIIMLMITMVTAMLLSRFRTLEEYGTYSVLNIVISLAAALLMFGLPSSANYFLALANTSADRRKFLSVYFSSTTLLSLLIGLVLMGCVPVIESYFHNPNIHRFAYYLMLYPWAHTIIAGVSNVLVVYGRSKTVLWINVVSALVALGSVLIIEWVGLSFDEYMIAFLAGNCLLALSIYVLVNRLDGRLRLDFDWRLLKKIFAYSIPIGLASLVGTINVEVDKLMIGYMMGPEEVAIYTNAGKELPLVFVAASLTAVLLPQMARNLKDGKRDESLSLWGHTVELSYMIICFFVTACIVFAPQVMTFLYSEKYLPGLSVFVVYSLVLLLRVTYFGMVLNALGKTKFIMWSSIISLALNVILNFVLFHTVGFVGPAIASFLSILAVNMLQLVITARVLHVSFAHIFPWRVLLKITGLNVAWGIAVKFGISLLGLGTSTAHVAIAIGLGALVMTLYAVALKGKALRLWKELNG